MLRQLLLLVVALAGSFVYIVVSQTKYFLKWWHPHSRARREVENKLWAAPNYSTWCERAHELDVLLSNDRWKQDPRSRFYDFAGLQARLAQLKESRRSGADWGDRLALIRENLDRNICGIGQPWLYLHATVGTKQLIQDYVAELALQIERDLLDALESEVPRARKERFLLDARQAFGRTALVLNGGMTLGLFHMGVVKCLCEQGCLPPVICGTSIGALIAGLLGACTDEELPTLWGPEARVSFDDFSEPALAAERRSSRPAWARKITRLLKQGVLNDIKKLGEFCRRHIGDMTFREAYERTGRSINITVPTARVRGFRGAATLLNYITAPNVVIWSAACASCEYPGLYSRFDLRYKELDGSIKLVHRSPRAARAAAGDGGDPVRGHHDLPMDRLAALFNVNHFVVSQVHPHMLPFLRTRFSRSRRTFIHRAFVFLIKELWHLVTMFAEYVWEPSFFSWIRDEVEYMSIGDVVIVPRLNARNLALIFSNPSQRMFNFCIREAEVCTYSQVLPVQIRCRIEFALHNAVRQVLERHDREQCQLEDEEDDAVDAAAGRPRAPRGKGARRAPRTTVLTRAAVEAATSEPMTAAR